MIGQLPIVYELARYALVAEKLDVLLQRMVEHGFMRFYERLETFFHPLTQGPTDENHQFQFEAITMQNIWIYVYIFAAANCFSCLVFLGEIVVFHRRKIYKRIRGIFVDIRNALAFYWRNLKGLLSQCRQANAFIWRAFQTNVRAVSISVFRQCRKAGEFSRQKLLENSRATLRATRNIIFRRN